MFNGLHFLLVLPQHPATKQTGFLNITFVEKDTRSLQCNHLDLSLIHSSGEFSLKNEWTNHTKSPSAIAVSGGHLVNLRHLLWIQFIYIPSTSTIGESIFHTYCQGVTFYIQVNHISKVFLHYKNELILTGSVQSLRKRTDVRDDFVFLRLAVFWVILISLLHCSSGSVTVLSSYV